MKKNVASLLSISAILATGAALTPACGSPASRDDSFAQKDSGTQEASVEEGPEGDASEDSIFIADTKPPTDVENPFDKCATGEQEASTDPITLEIVLDGSGSMDGDNKWVAATGALNAVFDALLAKNDPNLTLGLIVYSDTMDATNSNGPYPQPNVDIYPALVDQAQHDRLANRINATQPSGSTPTYKALQGGQNVLLAYKEVPPAPPAASSRKVIILMTDGVPDGGSSEQQQCIQSVSTGLALAPPKGPIKTFSVGIGPFPGGSTGSYDSDFMGELAVAGGTRLSPQCNPHATSVNQTCHFQITPGGKPASQLKTEFINALNRIRGLATGCEYNIVLGDAGEVDTTKINVVWVDGSGHKHVVAQDDVDGWSYDDPNNPHKVILNGQACGDVTQDLGAAVSVVLGCPTVTK